MTSERIDELLALAVLGELDEHDAAELDAALADDAELYSELDLDHEVAATLQRPLAEQPPAELKANVMAAIDALEERVVVPPTAVPSTAVPPIATPPSVDDAPEVVPIGSARSRRRGFQALATAAAVVALFAGGMFVFSRTASAPTDVDVIASADDASERVLSAGDLSGELAVVYSPSQDAFVLVGTDIPVLTDDETYQLWLVGDAGAESVGVFAPDDDGRVAERYDGRDPSEFLVGVTIEPAGGSDSPTEPIQAITTT